jgi:hypothetical protein
MDCLCVLMEFKDVWIFHNCFQTKHKLCFDIILMYTGFGSTIFCYAQRRVWRYQRGNQNPYIEEEQTMQWPLNLNVIFLKGIICVNFMRFPQRINLLQRKQTTILKMSSFSLKTPIWVFSIPKTVYQYP